MGQCSCTNWKAIEKNTYPDFSYNGIKCYAKVVDIYDGDTGRIVFKENGIFKQYKFRLIGIDTPELKPPLNTPNREEIVKKAKEAKEYVVKLILNKVVWVEMSKFDKYGRILVNIYPKYISKKSINQLLLESKLGKEYFGGTKT